MASIFTESEQAWLDLRAEKISAETGDPLPVARSKAVAQLVRLRNMPKAVVVAFRPRRRCKLPATVEPSVR